MTNRHEAALLAALAERDWIQRNLGFRPVADNLVVGRIVEAALSAADAHDGAGEAVLCSDGSRVHDFQGERVCPGCGWAGIFAAEPGAAVVDAASEEVGDGDEAKNYKRLGHLVAEYEEHHDDQGELIGAGMFAAELYACDTCHAVVWWGSMSDHDAWHKAHDGPRMVAVEESDDLDW